MGHTRQSRPEHGIVSQVKDLKPLMVIPLSPGSKCRSLYFTLQRTDELKNNRGRAKMIKKSRRIKTRGTFGQHLMGRFAIEGFHLPGKYRI